MHSQAACSRSAPRSALSHHLPCPPPPPRALQECRESPEAQPAPWGTMERLSPLLYTWAQARGEGWVVGWWRGGGSAGAVQRGPRMEQQQLGAPTPAMHWCRHGPPLALLPSLAHLSPLLPLSSPAGPDLHAGRLDGAHPGLRGLDPRVQAARPWLAVRAAAARRGRWGFLAACCCASPWLGALGPVCLLRAFPGGQKAATMPCCQSTTARRSMVAAIRHATETPEALLATAAYLAPSAHSFPLPSVPGRWWRQLKL